MNILVLMSAYNGEKYIEEQVDSILSQENVDLQILIRDDGSSDKTVQILREYQKMYPERVILVLGENIGCKSSFYNLAELAREYSHVDYFAWADQDDVWKPEKVSVALDSLHQFDESIPILYGCAFEPVDAHLQKLPFKKQGYTNTLGEACIINMILGCTMVFNRKALELFLRAKREDITSLHDEWLYKACLAVEGNVVYDTTSHILYRQHGSNVVGANKGAFQQWKGRWLNFWGCKRTRSTVLLNIWKVYSNLIPECNKSIILPLISTSRNPFRRIYTMFSPKYKTLSKSTNILFKLSFLTNRY